MILDLCIYASSGLLLRGISLITAPITMRLVSPAAYGLLALAHSFISIVTLFFGLGLRQALSLEYFHYDTIEQKKMINDIILIYCMISGCFFFLLICLQQPINVFFFRGHANSTIIMLSIIICMLYFFVELLYQLLQYQTKVKQLAYLQTSIALLTMCLQLLFLYYYHLGIISMLLAQSIGMLIAIGCGLYIYLKRKWHTYIDIARSYGLMRHYTTLGLPFIPSVLFGWLLSSGDRWVLAQLSSMHAVGIYAIADSFCQLFNTVILYPLSCSYIPYMLRTYTQNKNLIITTEQQNQKIMWLSMIGIILLITIGYIISKPLLQILLPTSYHEAITYIWFLLMGSVFLMGTYFANCFIQYHKKRYFLGFAPSIPAIINIMLNYILIPHYQLYGCIGATLTAYIIYFGITVQYNYYLQSTIQGESIQTDYSAAIK